RHWAPIRLTQDLHHLLFREPALLHGFLPLGSHFLKNQSVRESPGRSQVWGVQLLVQAVRPRLLKGYLSDPAGLEWRWEK
ncbi:MAG TPA: hypothetical protein VK714_18390, partial [Myxococcota bacterium]|nr:hypothetical protein [Myxococcota bacterium]